MTRGALCLVLHAHMPFVRHPEYPDFHEEDWFFEGVIETYRPLLQMLDRLAADGIGCGMTISLSPTLLAMMEDPLLRGRLLESLDQRIELARREIERNRWQPEQRQLAHFYHDRFLSTRDWLATGGDLIAGFAAHARAGRIELMTCPATHPYLPLLRSPASRWAQIEFGCQEFERQLGWRPQSLWLPECGFDVGVDLLLRDAGIESFLLDVHAAPQADPYLQHRPHLCPESGIAYFLRDQETSRQVWSSVEGYPGCHHYRDFHRDIGHDLDYFYLQPHLHSSGMRSPMGIKYHRITGPTPHKEPYQLEQGQQQADDHARHFVEGRLACLHDLQIAADLPAPMIVAPYDAELFGHWWFEGIDWLDGVLRYAAALGLTTQTLSGALRSAPATEVVQPISCSWGTNGFHETWLNETNDWIYPLLADASERMTRLARRGFDAGLPLRVGRQAARELVLAQSSDWAFIMNTPGYLTYASNRTRDHLARFHALADQLEQRRFDAHYLAELEKRDNCFPAIDPLLFA